MDCSIPGTSVHGGRPWWGTIISKKIGVGCHPLLQGIFPNQGSNPGLPHCRRILYHLSHQGSPDEARNTEVHVSLQSMIFSWYISRGLQLFKSHCWHPCQAGPRPSQKQKHFSQCQPLTPLVILFRGNSLRV